ncbi:type II toxin-antitoxin system RelE/ParE family toxin [Scytonema sp. NUACC26]|uniref:type II toxin-antitoxin system RelE/ParE family toxin n=1 Tax=Scytonema sp. NUACC26 TaxID=3140176 RepID=UPI0034DB9B6A
MSSPNYTLKLSTKAKKDIVNILAYTLGTWGDVQVEKYKAILDKGLQTIETYPEIGKSDIPPYLYLQAGEHYIFYKIKGNKITISRVLHNKMDLKKHV